VDVDIAEAWKVEHPLRDDAAVGYDDDGVGDEGFKGRAEAGVVLEVLGLEDGEIEALGELLDGGKLEFLLAAGGTVGLGEDEGDFMAGVDESLEARDGEFWGSAEDEFHGLPRCGHLPVAVFLELFDATQDQVALKAA
jgi:hypothetical protein